MFYVYLRANQLTKASFWQFDIPPNVSYKQLADILLKKPTIVSLDHPWRVHHSGNCDELEAQQIITNAKQFLNYIKQKQRRLIHIFQANAVFIWGLFSWTYYFSLPLIVWYI